MQQSRNHLVFFIVVLLLFVGYYFLKGYIFPEKKEAERPVAQERESEPKKEPVERAIAGPTEPAPTPDRDIIWIGEEDAGSPFHLYVGLDSLGGGVRSIWLNKFKKADEDGRPSGEMLELVTADANRQAPSFLLSHFDIEDETGDFPLDVLGRRRWEVVKKNGEAVQKEETEDGGQRWQVSFRTRVQGVVLTRTYTLKTGEYHLGLKVEMAREAAGPDAGKKEKRPIQFRYQLAGGKGLPVEGKWYTSTFRNAYVVQEERGKFYRDLQTLQQLGTWAGGNNVPRDDNRLIRYAGVAVQYFASVIVVDNEQEDQKFLRRARPTLERGVVRGKLKTALTDRVVILEDDGKTEQTVHIPPDLRKKLDGVEPGATIAVVYRPLSYDPYLKASPRLAVSVRLGSAAEATHALWEDDITMRVTTEKVELSPGDKVTHDYLLYHGPVKPSLLAYMHGKHEKVDSALIDRYADTLGLNSMTDYPSPGFMGTIGHYSKFSYLVIFCTNLMHRVLGFLTSFVPSYGLCIILLTVLVRGLMFPLSRRQALMSIKMQALAPEVKKLAEKYKDDHQALGKAQMELWRKHGVNPLGSCWVLLLQMPIFMGLYYALQESIEFRLAPFWPTWIQNLAAPDMMIPWSDKIPWISRPQDFGGFLYLGPYLNLLPVIAVTLMIVQQKMMTPPAADEQQAMQQKMMKYMMVIFGLMFYKVAAGLCIYFIASSLWGFAERKLLPKTKPVKPEGDGQAAADGAPKVAASSTAVTQGPSGRKPGRNRRKDRGKKDEEMTRLGQLRQRLSDWWNDVLEKARKK